MNVTALAIAEPHAPTSEEVKALEPLVRKVAARLMRRLPRNVQRDDLVAAGRVGLFDALRKAGRDRGPSFEAYARTRIHGAILDELRRQDWASRGERRKIAAQEANAAAIVAMDDLSEATRASWADASEPPALDQLEAKEARLALDDAMDQLPVRERLVVHSFYLDDVPLTDVAAALRVSLARASQLKTRGLSRLQALMTRSSARSTQAPRAASAA